MTEIRFDKTIAERLCAEAEEDDARCDAPSLSDRSASQFACGVRQRRHRERDLAAQLRAAMAEVERLRGINAESGEWIDSAAKLEIELRARVETFRNSMYALESQVTQLREQLSAALAAKDEACEIALQWAAHLRDLHGDPRDRTRIVELRSIGKDGGNG